MQPILIASVTPYVGKNVIAMGLAERLRRDKKRVGYFKPIGPLPTRRDGALVDEDAAFFKKVLHLSEPLDVICPLVLSDQVIAELLRGDLKDAKKRVLSAYKTASQGKDAMLVMNMGRMSCGRAFGFSMDEFAKEIDARVVTVERYHWPTEVLDGVLHMKDLLPKNFAGVIFNRLMPSQVSHIDRAVRPFLKASGVELLGALADDPVLNAVPVSALVEALNGKVLCCEDKLDALVERFSIGAMNAEAALRFFQRVPNKAVITGGDRADIQLAALQTSTRCLVLTGDLYPNERILSRAVEAGVPVVLVSQETSAVAEACEQLHGHLSLTCEAKISRASEVVDKGLDWDAVHRQLGI